MAPTALLFDVDCTLWDSPTWYSDTVGDLANIRPDTVFHRLLRGDSIVSIIAEYGISRSRFIRGCLSHSNAPVFYPHVRGTLEELLSKGMPMGVVTRLPGTIVDPLLEGDGIARWFKVVVHAGNCRARKPNPECIYAALGPLGVAASDRVYYIGDSAVDAVTARNAGISFAWVSYAYERDCPEGSRRVIDDFKELARL